MNEQTEIVYPVQLYDGSPPHESPATSVAAAESVKETSGKQRLRILWLFQNGALGIRHGWTDDELEEVTGLRHQSLSARRRELVLLGKVKDSGRTRKTRSGRSATVWVLA